LKQPINEPKVSIIIPIYNGIEYTKKCIESIRENVKYSNYDIIIVDDGSVDNSVEIISKCYPDVVIIPGNGNLWWSGAMNLGISYSLKEGTDYILCLNNDNIIKSDVIRILVDTIIKKKKIIVASMVYFIDHPQIIRYAGGKISKILGMVKNSHLYEKDNGQFKECFETEWLGGMGVLVPKELFEEVGYFDNKNFPQYAGDQDLWLRAIKLHYRIIINPSSKIYVYDEKTGIKINNVGLLNTVKSLFSIKYHANIITKTKFFLRHFPYSFPLAILSFYMIGIYKSFIFKNNIQNNVHKK
jgi:GT2 family glycosyltransferase